ncbi:hypothetical protein NDU88_002996 [Pleurodeles waltl]|uniref:Uncharacterized protein n=1 Tax=Pleurodeles waltl TaxID=8319 RepID=A0AAV7Q7Q4_PLEWA|nr:hypothetical protein NDU88_002996 [Pleurodeles waltl]
MCIVAGGHVGFFHSGAEQEPLAVTSQAGSNRDIRDEEQSSLTSVAERLLWAGRGLGLPAKEAGLRVNIASCCRALDMIHSAVLSLRKALQCTRLTGVKHNTASGQKCSSLSAPRIPSTCIVRVLMSQFPKDGREGKTTDRRTRGIARVPMSPFPKDGREGKTTDRRTRGGEFQRSSPWSTVSLGRTTEDTAGF